MTRVALGLCLVAALGLTACSGDRPLRDLRTSRASPEDFAIVPNKPLEIPERLAGLPTPTPGGANRTDPTPLDDAVVALGGRPSRVADGIPASDAALVTGVSRYGVDQSIRTTLRREDEAYRARKRLFNYKLVQDDAYADAYAQQSLDPQLWLDRVRRPGTNVRTPSAPPVE